MPFTATFVAPEGSPDEVADFYFGAEVRVGSEPPSDARTAS